MKQLTREQVDAIVRKYEKKPGFRSLTVYNFLLTAHNSGNEMNARANLEMDARLYSWKASIVNAISEGLKLTR